MTKNELERLAESLEQAAEVFGYYVEEYRCCKDVSVKDALTRSEVAMGTTYDIAIMLGIENAYEIKETGIKQGQGKFIEMQSHKEVS